MKTDPNDVFGVIWTLGELSLLFIRVFSYKLMFYNKYSIYSTRFTTGWARSTKTGPNDANDPK